MAWARKTKWGRWQGQYRDEDKKVRTVGTFELKSAAKRAADEQERKMRLGEWTDPALARTTFGDFATEVTDGRLHLRPASRSRDDSYMKNHVIPAFGDVPVQRISKAEVQKWIRVLSEEKKLAPSTVRECRRLLSGIMEEAVEERLIQVNPCRRVRTPRIVGKEKGFLTGEQIEQLADAMDPRYRASVFVGAYLGLRWGEMAGLKRKHLHLHQLKPHATIVGSLERFENGFRYVEETKTTSGRRSLPLTPNLVEELAQHLAQTPDSEFVFMSPTGRLLHHQNWRKRFWQPAVERAGLVPLVYHELRHTAATIMLDLEQDELVVQRRMGHKDIHTTKQIYGHVFPEREEVLTNRMQAFHADARMLHAGSGVVVDLPVAEPESG